MKECLFPVFRRTDMEGTKIPVPLPGSVGDPLVKCIRCLTTSGEPVERWWTDLLSPKVRARLGGKE